MYASAYFMIGLTGVVCFQLVAAQGTGQAGDSSVAGNLASNTLEDLHTRSPSYLQSVAAATLTYDRAGVAVASNPYFTVDWTAVQPTGSNFFDVAVTVSWKGGSGGTFPVKIERKSRIATW